MQKMIIVTRSPNAHTKDETPEEVIEAGRVGQKGAID
jgi:hypothetical protein